MRRDLDMGRVYIPQEDMERFGYTEEKLHAWVVDDSFRDLMRFQVDRARALFDHGAELVDTVEGAVRLDIALFTLGGLHILKAIERRRYDVISSRPTLSKLARTWACRKDGGRAEAEEKNLKPPAIGIGRRSWPVSWTKRTSIVADSPRSAPKNFYYAFITLPAMKRRAIYAIYAFCRLCDDATDDFIEVEEKMRLVAEQRALLARACAGEPEGQVYVALEDTINTYSLPMEYLEEVINGVEMDISKTRVLYLRGAEGVLLSRGFVRGSNRHRDSWIQ